MQCLHPLWTLRSVPPSPSPVSSALRLALALLLALAMHLRGANAEIGSAAPAESLCVVAVGARTFDLGALGTAPLRFTSRDAGSLGWVYAFSACADVPPCSVSTFCDASLRGSVIQATDNACHSLGLLSTRVVSATENGVIVSFNSGDRCGDVPRSTSITNECADTAIPEILYFNQPIPEIVHLNYGAQPCSYSVLVRARAGCPTDCRRDSTGAVCGGSARGTCTSDKGTDMPAHCVCSEGLGGRACESVAALPKADVGAGMGLLLTLAILFFNCVKKKNDCAFLFTSTLLLVVALFALEETFAPESLFNASISSLTVQMQVRPQHLSLCVGVGDQRTCWARPDAPYRILFHSNQLCERGTEVALYDYAHFFELLAGGVSYIASNEGNSLESKPKFEARFPGRVFILDKNITFASVAEKLSLDAIYTIQGDTAFDFHLPDARAKLLVHGVFDGTRGSPFSATAVIHPSVPRATCMPVVNHIVFANESFAAAPSLRRELNIDEAARVFCRHGGADTFSITEAREAVCSHARAFPWDVFLLLGTSPLLGTNHTNCEIGLPNIVHLPKNTDLLYKARFLSSCNACVHARGDGETFGLAVAECSLAGLPVITYAHPPAGADAHVRMQGRLAITYNSGGDLEKILASFNTSMHRDNAGAYRKLYAAYSPDAVMHEFLVNFGILAYVQRGGKEAVH
jgi:hypothetical protein